MAEPRTNDYVQDTDANVTSGWVEDEINTWTYSSADSPTFVASVNADMTAAISAGMRVRLTQTTVKYFIVTAVGSYSGGATLITLYGGTDYVLADAAISTPGWSSFKAPFGFPLDPDKWTVEAVYSSDFTQATPTAGTWYNVTSITAPIGIWLCSYNSYYGTRRTAGDGIAFITLSTSSSTETNTKLTCRESGYSDSWSTDSAQDVINLASKTTYYFNALCNSSSTNYLYVFGASVPTVIRFVCAYL